MHDAVTRILRFVASVCNSFRLQLTAALSSDAKDGDVGTQFLCMDKALDVHECCFSGLIGLCDYWSHLGMLLKSSINTKAVLHIVAV